MKKLLAMVMLMVMVLTTMAFTANAEILRIASWRTQSADEGATSYFVTFQSQSGEEHEFQVSEAEFEEAVKELRLQKEAEEKKNSKSSEKNGFQKAIGWISFWNPND